MWNKRSLMVYVVITLVLFPAPRLFAYGGDGGGGGSDGGSNQEAADSAGGGVSWAPNPNGVNVVGSSIYTGRSAVVEAGPYQSGTAVEDAEQALLDGFQSGAYTADEVKANLEWAVMVGIKISDQAQQALTSLQQSPSAQMHSSQQTAQSGSGAKTDDEIVQSLAVKVFVMTNFTKAIKSVYDNIQKDNPDWNTFKVEEKLLRTIFTPEEIDYLTKKEPLGYLELLAMVGEVVR
ncbi:MAG: hypothetical protein JW884_05450 [Deltaproteobacteria bacterium]|nr:hypothetical protein [Deltaproteobacteria bacterium]